MRRGDRRTEEPGTAREQPHGRERAARVLGVVVALLAMGAFWYVIRWPAPAVSIVLGYLGYRLVRPRSP